MVKIDYDSKMDILYIYKENEKSKFSFEVMDNYIVDVGFNSNVVGLQINNISKLLKISKNELKDIKQAKLSTIIKDNFYGVIYSLVLKKMTVENQVMAPVAKAIEVRS
jgi:uncharacterized protein YuzE